MDNVYSVVGVVVTVILMFVLPMILGTTLGVDGFLWIRRYKQIPVTEPNEKLFCHELWQEPPAESETDGGRYMIVDENTVDEVIPAEHRWRKIVRTSDQIDDSDD